jgi:hypothetical protein
VLGAGSRRYRAGVAGLWDTHTEPAQRSGCRGLVFVKQPAEPVAAADGSGWRRRPWSAFGRVQTQRAVRTAGGVVADVLAQHAAKAPLAHDEQPI